MKPSESSIAPETSNQTTRGQNTKNCDKKNQNQETISVVFMQPNGNKN